MKMTRLDQLHAKIRSLRIFIWFTWGTRILLALGFIPSGMKKVLGNRFTNLGIDTDVGFFNGRADVRDLGFQFLEDAAHDNLVLERVFD